jgi:hypothetical protein
MAIGSHENVRSAFSFSSLTTFPNVLQDPSLQYIHHCWHAQKLLSRCRVCDVFITHSLPANPENSSRFLPFFQQSNKYLFKGEVNIIPLSTVVWH